MPSKTVRVLEKLGLVAIGAAIFMVVSIGTYALYENSKWDPLGEYPVQKVTPFPTKGGVRIIEPNGSITLPPPPPPRTFESSDNSTSNGVRFYLDDDINSNGIKCVKPEEDIIQIKGTLFWQSDLPPGRLIKIAEGAGPRGPGCQQYDFANPVPEQVLAEIEKLSAKGITESEWHLTGTETPIRDDGEEGVSRTWITTTFTLVHEDRPKS
jgi:hypothetical protein